MTSRPLVLFTGFGPFPGVPVNASAALVSSLADRARAEFPECQFQTLILPTEWHAAPRILKEYLKTTRPLLILHFGVTAHAAGFRIETQARNICRIADDAAGMKPLSNVLIEKAPAVRAVSIPVDATLEELSRLGFPAETSSDAGDFLCNALLYHSLAYSLDHKPPCRIGFVHIPRDLSCPPLSFVNAVSGSLAIVRIGLSGSAAIAVNALRSGARFA